MPQFGPLKELDEARMTDRSTEFARAAAQGEMRPRLDTPVVATDQGTLPRRLENLCPELF